MKTLKCLMTVMVWVCVTVSFVLPTWGLNPQPEPPIYKSITLPKGTMVEKLGPGHFKFKLPDGQVVEVKGLVKSGGSADKHRGATAIIGDSGIYDRTGKLITSGKQGSLKSGPKPTEDKHIKIDPRDFVKIDDDVTWLPITIQFQVESKGKGLSPQPDPPGKR